MNRLGFGIAITLLLPLAYTHAAGGTLYISPPTGVHRIGEVFEVQILADTGGNAINAAEADIAYNPGDFAVENISTQGSILGTWSTAPAYDGASGIISFSGWAEHPYSGTGGLLATVALRPLRVAQSTLLFNSGSMLASDGKGSNVISTMSPASFAISPAQAQAPSIPAASSSAEIDSGGAQAQSETPAPSATLQAAAAESQGASLLSSGLELAPIAAGFFGLLVLIAFCVAYIIHRQGR